MVNNCVNGALQSLKVPSTTKFWHAKVYVAAHQWQILDDDNHARKGKVIE